MLNPIAKELEKKNPTCVTMPGNSVKQLLVG